MQNKKLTYKINLTPFELFNTVILLFIAVAVFFGVLWMGGTLIGSGGMSCDTYSTKYKPMIIISESMTPTIAVNSLLFVEDKAYSDLEIGDIILFNTAEHGLVGHRIVEQVTEGFKTKGDNNDTVDAGVVKDSSIEGKILFSIPKAGAFMKTAALPAGIAVTLLYIFMKVIYRGKRL